MTEGTESDNGADNQPQISPWMRATLADVTDFDFEAPVAQSHSADSQELRDLYRRAANPGENNEVPDTQAGRVFAMLWAVAGMHFRPREVNDPFGAMLVLSGGGRSAIPADFRGPPLDVLSYMAERAKHPVLRARLADVCWLLDRKRSAMAALASEAYVEIVKMVDAGELNFRFDDHYDPLKHDARDLLSRALQIGRAIGPDKPGPASAREMVSTLRARAFEKKLPIPIDWFAHLDLDFEISDAATVGSDVEAVIAALPTTTESHSILELWRLATRAYHLAKKDEDKFRARSSGAEQFVTMARQQPSAMLGAQFLAEAIAELHGVPGKKDRRKELNHLLVDTQANISEEMSSFSVPLDLKDIVQRTEQDIRVLNLKDKLFAFAALSHSPDPQQLIDEARSTIKKYPLSSLFGASHHDREGKVIHRSESAGFGEGEDGSAVARQIAQSETLRRQLVAAGRIEPARQAIVAAHYISDEVFGHILVNSPFVPHDLLMTFCRGFVRFFQGDFVSGLYILTPLLENSLRHVLKRHGQEVSKFDDARLTQQDRTISVLFEQMRAELDTIFGKALTTDIENVFLKKPGPYLRHGLSHGLLHDGDPYGPDAIYACWLIFQLCLTPLFPYRTRLSLPIDDANRDLAQPPMTDTSDEFSPAK
jgi:hypothetical protein